MKRKKARPKCVRCGRTVLKRGEDKCAQCRLVRETGLEDWRTCLGCDVRFWSASPGHRLCPACRDRAAANRWDRQPAHIVAPFDGVRLTDDGQADKLRQEVEEEE